VGANTLVDVRLSSDLDKYQNAEAARRWAVLQPRVDAVVTLSAAARELVACDNRGSHRIWCSDMIRRASSTDASTSMVIGSLALSVNLGIEATLFGI
jgi:hypothetical protein